jgi:hypothetical protein
MEQLRRKKEDRHVWSRVWSRVLKVTIGYGFYSWWALLWLLGLTALGWIAFGRGYLGGAMVPSDAQAYASFESQREPPAHYPAFCALVYSLENSLPFVTLAQSSYWQPRRVEERRLAAAGHGFLARACNAEVFKPERLRWVPAAEFLRWFRWLQVLLGWLLATLFVAGVTGVVRQE